MRKYKNLIDVREPWEYDNGHIPNSVNIPLGDVQTRLDEIKDLEQPFLLCCQSGKRSGVATNFLQNEGFDCENGGGWETVKSDIENQKVSIEK